jgi:hypothetical protein
MFIDISPEDLNAGRGTATGETGKQSFAVPAELFWFLFRADRNDKRRSA